MKDNALMAGQQVTPGKGSSTLADKGLLLSVCSDSCKHQSIGSITKIHAWRPIIYTETNVVSVFQSAASLTPTHWEASWDGARNGTTDESARGALSAPYA